MARPRSVVQHGAVVAGVQSVLPGQVHPSAYGNVSTEQRGIDAFQNRIDPTRRLQESRQGGLLDPKSGDRGIQGPDRRPLGPLGGETVDEQGSPSLTQMAAAFMEHAAGVEETHRNNLGTYGREFVAQAPTAIYRKPRSEPSFNPTRRPFYVRHPF